MSLRLVVQMTELVIIAEKPVGRELCFITKGVVRGRHLSGQHAKRWHLIFESFLFGVEDDEKEMGYPARVELSFITFLAWEWS